MRLLTPSQIAHVALALFVFVCVAAGFVLACLVFQHTGLIAHLSP